MPKFYTVTKQTVEAELFKSFLLFGNPEEEPKSKSTYKQRAHSLFGVWAVRQLPQPVLKRTVLRARAPRGG